jgi:hypothetical protein
MWPAWRMHIRPHSKKGEAMIRNSIKMAAVAMAIFAAVPASAGRHRPPPVPPTPPHEVPEPADFALFLLGVGGLVIGRRSSRARRTRAD